MTLPTGKWKSEAEDSKDKTSFSTSNRNKKEKMKPLLYMRNSTLAAKELQKFISVAETAGA